MKKMKTLWFVNYSYFNKNRTVETKLFYKLKVAKKYIEEKHGYIIRQSEKNTVYFTTPGFDPSPIEQKKIDNILQH